MTCNVNSYVAWIVTFRDGEQLMVHYENEAKDYARHGNAVDKLRFDYGGNVLERLN